MDGLSGNGCWTVAAPGNANQSPVLDHSLGGLTKRCLQCPQAPLKCPSCGPGKVCILIPPSCEQCAHMECITKPDSTSNSGGPNVGAIAGGVAGGAAFIVLLVFLVWFFWIKKRREQQDKELWEQWENDEVAQHKRSAHFTSIQDAASTRTRQSLANSMLSRASNFIQIAYIPGVTNRNGSGRNSIVSPVPPIPAAHRQNANQKSPLSRDGDALFFGIDDLRGSTYSARSSVRDTRYSSNRDTRYTMQSITPSLARDSVASDVFWDNATTAPMPASTLARVAPRMVSVKANASGSPVTTPEAGSSSGAAADYLSANPGEVPVSIPGEGLSPSSSVRGKATEVTLHKQSKSKGRFPIRQPGETSTPRHHIPLIPSPLAENDNSSISDSDTEEHARARDSLLRGIDFFTPPADAQPAESPFFDASDLPHAAIAAASSTRPNPYASMASTVGVGSRSLERSLSPHGRRGGSKGKIGGLSAVIEEATKRASISGASGLEENPFGDEHATKE